MIRNVIRMGTNIIKVESNFTKVENKFMRMESNFIKEEYNSIRVERNFINQKKLSNIPVLRVKKIIRLYYNLLEYNINIIVLITRYPFSIDYLIFYIEI